MNLKEINFSAIPPELKKLPYWRVWFAKKKKNKPGLDKFPTINGKTPLRDWSNKKYDLEYDQAVALFKELQLSGKGGIGIRIAPEGNFTALDFDHTKKHKDEISDTYTEFSPSQNGRRQIVFGRASGDCSNQDTNVEIYSGWSGRFVTITGDIVGTCRKIRRAKKEIEKLYQKHKSKKSNTLDKNTAACPNIKELPDVDLTNINLHDQIRECILTGDASYYGEHNADRSRMLMGIASSLHNQDLEPEQILSVLLNNECNQKAKEQSRDINSAARWLWKYCVLPVVGPIEKVQPSKPKSTRSKISRDNKKNGSMPVDMAERIRKYIDGRMLRSQPKFTLAATLTLLSSLHGSCYVGQVKGTRLNLYTFIVAPPGASKTEPLSAVKELCDCCTESPIKYIESIGSPEGLEDCVMNHKNVCFLWEEAGKRLGHINHKMAQIHLAAIPDMLAKLYNASRSTFTRRYTANRNSNDVMMVEKPFTTMLGVGTISELNNFLTSRGITGGLVSRCLIFKNDKLPPMRVDYTVHEIPKIIREYIYARTQVSRLSGGEGKPKKDIIIKESPTVTKLFDKFRIEQEKVYAGAPEHEQSVRVRAEENARRVACVLAATADGEHPRITEVITRWAIKYVRESIDMVVEETEFTTDDTDYGKQRSRVLKVLGNCSAYAKNHNGYRKQLEAGMTPRKVLVQNTNLKARELNDIVNTLVESNEVGSEKFDDGVTYYWLESG